MSWIASQDEVRLPSIEENDLATRKLQIHEISSGSSAEIAPSRLSPHLVEYGLQHRRIICLAITLCPLALNADELIHGKVLVLRM